MSDDEKEPRFSAAYHRDGLYGVRDRETSRDDFVGGLESHEEYGDTWYRLRLAFDREEHAALFAAALNREVAAGRPEGE